MKYKLLSQAVVENLLAFLDEVQGEASMTLDEHNSKEITRFCSWAIKELLNAKDGITTDNFDLSSDEIKEQDKRWDKIDEKFFDWKLPPEMPDEPTPDRQAFDPPHIEDVAPYMTLEEVRDYLLDDGDLSDEEAFELYYDERERRNPKNKGLSYEQLLKKSGISARKR